MGVAAATAAAGLLCCAAKLVVKPSCEEAEGALVCKRHSQFCSSVSFVRKIIVSFFISFSRVFTSEMKMKMNVTFRENN